MLPLLFASIRMHSGHRSFDRDLSCLLAAGGISVRMSSVPVTFSLCGDDVGRFFLKLCGCLCDCVWVVVSIDAPLCSRERLNTNVFALHSKLYSQFVGLLCFLTRQIGQHATARVHLPRCGNILATTTKPQQHQQLTAAAPPHSYYCQSRMCRNTEPHTENPSLHIDTYMSRSGDALR